MPAIEPGDTVRLAAQDLIVAMQKLTNAPIDLNPKHTEALRQLTSIFNEAARLADDKENSSAPRVHNTSVPRVNPTPLPRVHTANKEKPLQPSTSTNSTSPKVLATTPRVHQRHTRNNTPMPTIHEESKQSLQRTRRREKVAESTSPIPAQP